MTAAALLVRALTAPAALPSDTDWTALISAARAEQLIGSLAYRLQAASLPDEAAAIFAMHRADAERTRVQALWEAEMCRRALDPLGVPVILLKGTAFHAAGLEACEGRSVGDLDIMVPRERIEEVEQALIAAGWERMKDAGSYDDLYYREWMHELPPLIHRERDRMIDVHHTILPLTARPKPNAEALLAASVPLGDGLRVLCPEDMIVHAAAHLIADGDLAGGLRNMWDIDRLVRQFGSEPAFWTKLEERARLHGLQGPVSRCLRLTRRMYETPVEGKLAGPSKASDRLFLRRLLARDGWGRKLRPATELGFYARGHWMRMPPVMLARHLLRKARG
jgi:hypothetical protein